MKSKIVTVAQAIALVRDGDTVACSGFVGSGTPEALLIALEQRFVESGAPRALTLVFAAAPGDGRGAGLDRLAYPGLVRRAIGGHWGLVPRLAELAVGNHIEAWNLPLGTLSQLFRDIAGHRAGCLTKVGLHTFVDPRQEGGRINAGTRDDLVRVMTIDGAEWLFFPSFPITVALIRATTSDPAGNLTMEREALTLDTLAIAMAARNSGGLVIAQVERIAAPGSLNARQVQVPGVLVDCVVVAEPRHHGQTFGTPYNPAYSAEIRLPADMLGELPLGERKVVARRCAFELPMGGVVNLGIGMPEGVAIVAHEERVLDHLTLTAEPGIVGGVPQSGLDFGAAVNADAVIAQGAQFDFYDGGGLDMACLGMAQVDAQGNVNVSRFGDRLAGAGGFINISQNARRVVFAGTFTAGGLDVRVGDGKLAIVREGKARKFVARVDQITFNGSHAAQCGREVVYVTERCVLRRTAQGVELTEVAPGVDIERDILAQMDFVPIVHEPKQMDPRIFRDEAMHLDDDLLGLGLAERVSVDEGRDILFLNLEGMHVRTRDDVDRVRRAVEDRCRSLGRKVALVVNYDGCSIDAAVADTYAAMVRYMEANYYTTATRYTTSAFMRMKLGEALARRRVAPHIFETAAEARAFLDAGRAGAER